MFTTIILAIHILVCVALIMVILLQSGKGADIGAVFGGGSSNTVFGSTGATPFLSKVTIGAAVLFMVTSIILTYFSGKGVAKRVLGGWRDGTEAPATAPVPGEDVQTGREGSATPGATTGQPGTAPVEAAPSAPAPKSEPAPGAGPSPSPPGSQ